MTPRTTTSGPSPNPAAALAGLPRAADPLRARQVIVACSRRKRATARAVPALELYEGGCVPQLRARLGGDPRTRSRIRILSARHGLLSADAPLIPYDQPLDGARAAQLRPHVAAALAGEFATSGTPCEVLVIAEPLYLVLIADLLLTGSRIHWVPDIRHGWPDAAAVLDRWGWP